MNVDYKKLLKQEPEAEDYVKSVLLAVFASDKNSHQLLGSIYSFYQIGMSVDDVTAWLKNMQRLNDSNEETE